MTASPDHTNVGLSVTNFGPIAKADIDLRPLTVFVGPSNTGKSYLAMLIYTLHKFFGETYGIGSRTRTIAHARALREWRKIADYPVQVSCRDAARLADWIDETVSPLVREDLLDDDSVLLPDFLASFVRPVLADWLSASGGLLDDEIQRSFGIADLQSLVRHQGRSGSRISLSRQGSRTTQYQEPIESLLTINRGATEFTSRIPDNAPLYIKGDDANLSGLEFALNSSRHDLDSDGGNSRQWTLGSLIHLIAQMAVPSTVGALGSTAHYLPADRAGIVQTHLVTVASVIERAPLAALRSAPLPELSGVLADFLTQLVRLSGPLRVGSAAGQKLAKGFEDKMLTGAISVEDSITGEPEYCYKPKGWAKSLPLMHASSMVSELAPVALYLRHVVQPGETLIIEEPEAHLHPALQVEFVRQLAAVVKSGVRVLLTTHSEWVLDELANRVLLSQLPKSSRKGIAGADAALTADEVGVWLFEPKSRPKGSHVRELPFSAEDGGFTSDYEDVAIDTHNDWAAISSRIEDLKAR